MKVEFTALVKSVNTKALVSGDKSHRATFETMDFAIAALVDAPADAMVRVMVEWPLKNETEV